MQGDGCNPRIARSLSGFDISQVVGIDTFTHFYGQWHLTSRLNGSIDDGSEKILLPWQSGATALASNFWNRATKIQINVVGPILGNQHGDSLGNSLRINSVELNGTNLF